MMEGGLMKFFGKGTTTRLIEDPEEKREKLIKFFKVGSPLLNLNSVLLYVNHLL